MALGQQLREARAGGERNGLLIGGFTSADHGLNSTQAGIGLLEQAARHGDPHGDIAAYAASLEARARDALDRIVKLRSAAAAPEQRAA